MKLLFKYSKEKDIEAILSGGKDNYGTRPTKVFEELQNQCNKPLDDKCIDILYIDMLKKKGVDQLYIESRIREISDSVKKVIEYYINTTESIFGTEIKSDITIYLTVSPRCPYSVKNNYFFVNMFAKDPIRIILHELWHFYTWQIFGQEEVNRLGEARYNLIKESLTVILNLEFLTLMEVRDEGYMEHKALRNKITNIWEKHREIKALWAEVSSQ
jgi:hypothetical protein